MRSREEELKIQVKQNLNLYTEALTDYVLEKEKAETRLKLLKAAYQALRSYQYGNQSTELAEEVADELEKELEKSREIASSQGSSSRISARVNQ